MILVFLRSDFVVVLIVVSIIFLLIAFVKNKLDRKKLFKFEKSILEKPYLEIDLETIIVEGFHYSENIDVDVYDNKIDSTSYTNYSNPYSLGNKFHKKKEVTRFYSIVKFTFDYKGSSYTSKNKIPIDEVSLRMQLLTQKRGKIYVLDAIEDEVKAKEGMTKFYLDLRFLNHDIIRWIGI